MRVQDLTFDDLILHGFIDTPDVNGIFHSIHYFHHVAFNEYNALPRPVQKNGKIIRYESYPWEDITETREYRGKPWKVIGCPWCWVVDTEGMTK